MINFTSPQRRRKKPYISFVVAARNDNYGGHFLLRIKTFFTALVHQIQKYDLHAEIVLVEWNPPRSRPRLSTILKPLVKTPSVIVKCIEVPFLIHQHIPNAHKMPIFEYIAKNVGVRRASGEYILVTNPDILFSHEFIHFLKIGKLDSNAFYRVDRFDIPQSLISTASENRLAYARAFAFQLQTLGFTIPLITWLPFSLRNLVGQISAYILRYRRRGQGFIENTLHTNTAGDFMLMSRVNWFHFRGYPELPQHYYMDAYLCCIADVGGLRQRILGSKYAIFHNEHARPVSHRPTTLYNQWVTDCKKMYLLKKPKMFNSSSWGLGNIKLKEYSFQTP